jgi:COP9 signalosome complex subunit 2
MQPFRNESEIVAMTALVEAYQQKDARAFETVLQNNKASIMDDPFIRDYIEGGGFVFAASLSL